MSREVLHAYWHFWQPGKQVDEAYQELDAFKKYLRKASKHGNDYRQLLLALAFDANALYQNEDCETAFCWTEQETLAQRIQRSSRTVQRLLEELVRWGELEVTACDGRCRTKVSRHRGTRHYYLFLPPGAQAWGRRIR